MNTPQKSRTFIFRWIVILVMLSYLTTACSLPWQRVTEDTTTKAAPETTPTETSTPEPLPDLPPALVEVSPYPNSIIGLEQPIRLTFNQPMNTASVEAAMQLEPAISGSFEWEADQVLTFTPDQALMPDSSMSISINTTAQAKNNQTLQETASVTFQTAESLYPLQTVPANDDADIAPDSAIFVAFNQSVVPLGGESSGEPAFTLSPAVEGTGQWLNTSTYIFYPSPSLDGGTAYTISLNDSLTSTAGTSLDPTLPAQFKFTTSQPQVTKVTPLAENRLSLDGPITLTFNIRMDPQSVIENVTFTASDGTVIEGDFDWNEDLTQASFTPAQNLAYDTAYVLTLDSAAQSFGGLSLEKGVEKTFQTYPTLAVDPSFTPTYGTYYGTFGYINVNLTTPVDSTDLESYVTFTPEVIGASIYAGQNRDRLNISGYFKPETTYTLEISPELSDIWGGKLGESYTINFTTPAAEPTLSVPAGSGYSNQLVFIPANQSEIILQATNITNVTLDLSPISMDDLIMLVHPDNYDYRQVFFPESVETTQHTLSLTPNVNETISLPLTYQNQALSPGVYFLQISSDDLSSSEISNYQRHILIVSNNNLVMKTAPDQALVWSTTLEDFSPNADSEIVVYNADGTQLASGVTDEDGLFMDNFTRIDDPFTTLFAMAGLPGEEDFAFTISTWGQGYTLYEMGINTNTFPKVYDAYVYTDRPIYQPGDTVHFKGYVYEVDNGLPITADIDTVTVKVFADPGMSGMPAVLFEEEMELSQFGTLNGSVQLAENAAPGYYHIEVKKDDQAIESLYFDVAAYRKPEIELEVTFQNNEILAGDALAADVQADYYFGMPAGNQPTSWTLFQNSQVYFSLPGYRVGPIDTTWLLPRIPDYSPYGAAIASGEGITDETGYLSITFPETVQETLADPLLGRQTLTLEVTLQDESGFPVTYRNTLLVHPEEIYIGVQPDLIFGAAEKAFNFTLLTVDWSKTPVSNVPIEASFEQIEWEIEATGDPTRPYRYETITTPVASASPVTDEDGQSRLSFTPPEPGTYQLTVQHGNAITQVIVWVSGPSQAVWPIQRQNMLKMTPDADSYQPGETAEVFFPNPFPEGAKALVTIERGEIMDSQVIDIEGAGYTLNLPLDDTSSPNIYLSIMLMSVNENGNPDYRYGVLNIPVTPIDKTLNIDLILDPQITLPDSTINATIKVTDPEGNPVQGEFSIAVVDKALLALVEPNSAPILDALYGNKPLAVQTSFSLRTYATQYSQSAMDLGRGGGGGDMALAPRLREEFPDTAFWEAVIITGVDGTAQIEIPIPDNLTTWVVDVRGLTDDALVGQTTAEILTSKPIMIRPVTPQFLVDGDHVQIAAIVHNNTGEDRSVDVSLQAVGLTLDEITASSQTVGIPAGESVRVDWWGSVESVESVELVFQALSGDLSDATTPAGGALPVLRYAMPYTFSTAGELPDPGQTLELISLPTAANPDSGELILELTPSLTASLIEGLTALETDGYDDTITILSRLLANLNAYLALNKLGVESPQLEANLERLANQGVRKLIEAQNFDGGWSWWVGDHASNQNSSPFITAYALLGLTQAVDAGLDVNDYYTDMAVEFLQSRLEQPGELDTGWKLDRLSFEIYALAKSDADLDPYLNGLFTRRSELSPWAMALLALTMTENNDRNADVLLSDLENAAIRSATGVHWQNENRVSWMLPGTPVFNTAISVYALAQLDPASVSLSPALRYIMAHQNVAHLWSSTFESAWSLMALTEALLGTGDYQADYDFQAILNDVPIAEGTATGPDSQTPISITTPVNTLHPNDPNALIISRDEGAGTLYYRADLHTYMAPGTAVAMNQGITLERIYTLTGEECDPQDGCPPIDGLTLNPQDPSQRITVTLTIIVPEDMYNLIIEDYIPAGTEILNQRFLTTQSLPSLDAPLYNPRDPFSRGWGWWYFNQPQIYDDHLTWTADYVPAGTYTLTYHLLPFQRGDFQVLPAHAWQYFYPEVQGTSAGAVFSIE